MKTYANLRNALAALVIVAGLALALPSQAQEPLAVDTTSGTLIGTRSNAIESWLGVPYAAAPVGALRWRPPQPVAPWTVPRKANALGSSCAQDAQLGVFAKAGGSEDCLFLNIYRAEGAAQAGQQRPVFVWIHGGALQVGQGGDYDASKLAQQGNAIVVTINYRLGVFGFLAHPTLDGEGHDFGNYGLMDQQAALRWVQQNIPAFGGDPNNVTISGESSGGNSVLAHIASPASAGLFQHVVAMSGGGIMTRYPAFGAPMPLQAAREKGEGFAKAAGCEARGADCLRALSTKQVLDAQAPFMMFEFIIDGRSLPMHPGDAYRQGKINKATLVTGSTRDEGRFFAAIPELMTGKVMSDEDYPVWIERLYGARLAPKVLGEYPLERYVSASEAYASASTDSMFSCPSLAMNRVLADKIPVYAYEFSDRTAPSYVGPTSFPLLAAHTYELAYVFPNFHGGSELPARLNPLQEKLSAEMVGYFANVSNLPSKHGQWPRFDPKKGNFMTFMLPASRMVSGRFAQTHHCAFWDKAGVY